MSHDSIYEGMHVLYVPLHAGENLKHPDVERGTVTSKNAEYIFVRFSDMHSKACKAIQLRQGKSSVNC